MIPRTLSVLLLTAALLAGAGCASPRPARPRDPDLENYAATARQAFRQGAFDRAENLYRRALARARAADDPLEIGNNAYNVAACLLAQGRPGAARPFLREARAELEHAGETTAEVLLLDAEAARAIGQPEEARSLLAEARAQVRERDRALALQVALLEARLACDRGDPAAAERLLNSMEKTLKRETDPLLRARWAAVRARIAGLEGQPAVAAESLDEEANGYRAAGGRARELAEALRRAGEAWREAGHLPEAADRFYRAARSLFAQGNSLEALKCLEPAVACAREAQAADLFRQIEALFQEIDRKIAEEKTAAKGAD